MTSPPPKFEVLVIGEFSGRKPESDAVHSRRPTPIDVDSFDQRFADLRPTIEIPLGSDQVRLEFSSLESLHPDGLSELPAVQHWLDSRPPTPDPEPPPAARVEPPASDERDLFAQLIGGEVPTDARPDPARDAIEELARRVVKPAAPEEPDQQGARRAEGVAQILNATGFRTLEGHWRGLHRLVSRSPDEPEVSVAMVDICLAELAAGFRGGGLNHLELPAFLGAGAHEWSLIVLASELRPEKEDLGILAALGVLGAQAHAPVLAGFTPQFLGVDAWADLPTHGVSKLEGEPGEIWHALRSGPVAPWLGLVGPRILARVPYGETSDPTELPIEETELTWSPASLGCAELLLDSFAERGWAFDSNDSLDLHTLPLAMANDGERVSPCEAWISERAAAAVEQLGFMVIQADRHRDRARLLGFHSIGDPATRLAGRWEMR